MTSPLRQQSNPKLRFSEFKSNWEKKTLSDFMSFKNGVNADKSQYGSGYKFINVLDIIASKPITYDSIIGSVDISEKDFLKNEVSYGDILFQRSSETREEAGQTNVYLDKEESATFGGFVIRGKPTTEFEPKYFNYLLKTDLVRKDVTSRSGGSTRFNVGQSSLEAVNVYVTPDHSEQVKIANFLFSLEQKAVKLTEKLELTQSYKRGVMQKIFSQEIRFKKDNDTAFPDWQKVLIQSLLDDGFIVSHLDGNHGALYPRAEEFVEEGIPYVSANDFVDNKVDFTTSKRLPENRAREFKKGIAKSGDVLFAHNATVGPTAILETSMDYVILSTTATYFRCDLEKLNNKFLLHSLNTTYFVRQYSRVMSQSTRNQVPITTQRKFYVLLPCLEEQKKIADFLSAIDTKIDSIQNQLTQVETFKKGLLQQMFV